MSTKRAKNKAASEKKKAQLKLNYKKKKAGKQCDSGPIISDDASPPVESAAAAVANVAVPVFMPADFRFNLGDSVETRPDSRPGVRGYHGETFVGTVLALDYKLRLVTIKSCFNGRTHPVVHESHVYPVPKSINGRDGFQLTRAVVANPNAQFQRELDKRDRRIFQQDNKTKRVNQ